MTTRRTAILLFPPNWSSCVSGPHLALPLMAGIARHLGWEVESWDLTQEFATISTKRPPFEAVARACADGDFQALDKLYFQWEDQFRMLAWATDDDKQFGLLSGFPLSRFSRSRLVQVAEELARGTIYTRFFKDVVIPRLLDARPSVVGLTIASQEQVVPALELLQLTGAAAPNAYVVLGGNVVTRLRETVALDVFSEYVDQVVVFQGEDAFARILETVGQIGVEMAKARLSKMAGDELIPWAQWPVPCFRGLNLGGGVGPAVLSYVSTRGCYWGKCHFCAIPAGWANRGYGGSAPGEFVAEQLCKMTVETGIRRVKFVDEAVPPSKVIPLCRRWEDLGITIEWEAYARLEPAWENSRFLEEAYAGGLRKLYLGLEQAPTASRNLLGKNDRGDPLRILEACAAAGVKVHLFCMVGHPGSSREDAWVTTRFLIDNQERVDTADLVGFRHDRGTRVPGVRPLPPVECDWAMSFPYEATQPGVLGFKEVDELEQVCQESIWENVPRLLHPLYRVVGPWDKMAPEPRLDGVGEEHIAWSGNFCSTR